MDECIPVDKTIMHSELSGSREQLLVWTISLP